MQWVLFLLFSYWLPQIVLSAVTDGRQPLKPVYIIGTSTARLALPLYLYGCPANLLRIPPSPRMLAALVAWVAAQVRRLKPCHAGVIKLSSIPPSVRILAALAAWVAAQVGALIMQLLIHHTEEH